MELEILEGILEVPEVPEVPETPEVPEGVAVKEVSAEIRTDLEGFENDPMIVTGQPFEIAEELDCSQGDNSYDALGCCGLVSCANYLTLCGIESSEEEIVGYAVENGLCNYSPWLPPENRGGTNDVQLETILESHGVDSTVYYPFESRGSLEGIAEAVESGHAVMMGINAGYLWDSPGCIDDGSVNHQITITGSVRDTNGELIGLTICDSGRGLSSDACRLVTVDELEACYTTAPGASVIISDAAVR